MTKKKHAVIVTNSFPNPEQPERGIFIAQIAQELRNTYEITVISPLPWFPKYGFLSRYSEWYMYSRIPSEWEWCGIKVFSSPYVVIPGTLGFTHPIFLFPSLLHKLKNINKHIKIDIINAFNLYPEGVAAVLSGLSMKIPVVLSARGSDVNYLAKMRGRRLQIKWALRNCTRSTGVSEALSRELVRLGGDQGKVRTIVNGINYRRFQMRSKAEARALLRISGTERMLLFVGLLKEVKGLSILIEALSLIREKGTLDFMTYIVGDGPLRRCLEEMIKAHQIQDRVTITGMRPHEEISLWMSAADAFCLPSINEGMPNVVLEALSSGTPVVGSRVGGIPELVKNGNGILVTPGDSHALSNALSKVFIMEWNKERIRESIQGLTWEATANQYSALYRDSIEEHLS